jgi:transglutaminase superfamily protein
MFENTRKGDCEDFALWTWRQLLAIGYDARFVGGQCGRYGAGHAWVEFFEDGCCYLLEPQLWFLGQRMPRLNTLGYHPRLSVEWDGEKLSYFEHRDPSFRLSFLTLLDMLPEYLVIWGAFWLRSPVRVPRFIWHLLKRFFRGFRWIGKTRSG